ncbi:MAG: histidine kinase dimerization/phosphoacceptor domain -containing protein [Flavobacteriales bacterium]|nr:histidine kinase dimerization/phosphoacceptor domain -containing protein [Flavobacteriales bacterium]
MDHSQINLLHELDSISKIHTLKRQDIDNLMIEFARRILLTLNIERMSVWLLDDEKNALVSMGEYDLPEHKFSKGNTLLREKYPAYIKAISENEILLVPNIYKHESTKELSGDYSKPHGIISLMDIPLRIEGELIGIMCFEKIGDTERNFSKDERIFALSIAIVFASNLEARQRRALQHTLNQELREKEVLMRELQHRVRNNMSVIASLVRLQSYKANDDYHKKLFDECKTKIDSIAGIHELVYSSKNYSTINALEYFTKLLNGIEETYSGVVSRVLLRFDIEELNLDVDQALPLALIANEVVTNSYKHAFEGRYERFIEFSLRRKEDDLEMIIRDNGKGFSPDQVHSDSLGIEIIKGLVEQVDGEYTYNGKSGTTFMLKSKIKTKTQIQTGA